MIYIVIWFLFGIASAIVMSQKDRSGCAGLFLGVMFGPIGLIISLVAEQGGKNSDKLITCKACGNEVSKEAEACPECGQPVRTKSGKKENVVEVECDRCRERFMSDRDQCPECGSYEFTKL